jgi:hemerythrin superfamily protein
MPDVVDLIKAQHRQVDDLLEKAQAEGAEVPGLLRQVSNLLLPHSQAEESFVYPAIRELDSSEADEVHDGVAEHHHIEQLLRELLSEDSDTPGFDGKLAAMVAELRHHVEEEEQDLLPILTEKASDEERERMGARFAAETGSGETGSGEAGSGEAGSGEAGNDATRDELYEKAKEQDVPGRSKMSKEELADAVDS